MFPRLVYILSKVTLIGKACPLIPGNMWCCFMRFGFHLRNQRDLTRPLGYENILCRPIPGIIISFLRARPRAYHLNAAGVEVADWDTGCGFSCEQSKQMRTRGDFGFSPSHKPVSTPGWISFLSFFFLFTLL